MPQNLLVAGLGVSGQEAALLALKKGYSVYITDSGSGKSLEKRKAQLTANGCKIIPPEELTNHNFNLAVVSPGVNPVGSFGKIIFSLNCPVVGELEFASRFTEIPLIGVTGTNGKTTTVELIACCLKELGRKVIAAGNIGLALSKVVREEQNYDFIVCEVSSFQLENVDRLHFKAGLLLNISSDHIDRYENPEDYSRTKAELIRRSEIKIASGSLRGHINLEGIKSIKYSVLKLKDGRFEASGKEFDFSSHPLCGIHNAENLLNTLNLLELLGFKAEEIWNASLNYLPAPHRLQHFLSRRGIEFYNDSKATNPHSLLMALESLGSRNLKNIVLIAGGRDKKMDFNIVNTALCSYVRGIFIYGECRSRLYELWNGLSSCEVCVEFDDAVNKAMSTLQEGDILLLSPACASLDSFGSYAERGNLFMKTVQEWTGYEGQHD